jgi:hypothetical protein
MTLLMHNGEQSCRQTVCDSVGRKANFLFCRTNNRKMWRIKLALAVEHGDTNAFDAIMAQEGAIGDFCRLQWLDGKAGFPLMAAVLFGKDDMLRRMVAAGFDVNSRHVICADEPVQVTTCLHVAVIKEDVKMLRLLLDLGADWEAGGWFVPEDSTAPGEGTPLERVRLKGSQRVLGLMEKHIGKKKVLFA